MEPDDKLRRFKSGLWSCWIAILVLPVGLLAIGGGPCAGPRNSLGSIILLGAGLCALGGAIFGIPRIVHGMSVASRIPRAMGVLSVCCAALAGAVGVIYLLLGYASASAFLNLG